MTVTEFLDGLIAILSEKTKIAFYYTELAASEDYVQCPTLIELRYRGEIPVYVRENLLYLIHAVFRDKLSIHSWEMDFHKLSFDLSALLKISEGDLQKILALFNEHAANVLTVNIDEPQKMKPETVLATVEAKSEVRLPKHNRRLLQLPLDVLQRTLKSLLTAQEVFYFSQTSKLSNTVMGDDYTFYLTLPHTDRLFGIDLKPDFNLLAASLTDANFRSCARADFTPALAVQSLGHQWYAYNIGYSILSVNLPKAALKHAFYATPQTSALESNENAAPYVSLRDVISIQPKNIASITRIHGNRTAPHVATGTTYVNTDKTAQDMQQPQETKAENPCGTYFLPMALDAFPASTHFSDLARLINQMIAGLPPKLDLGFSNARFFNCNKVLVALKLPEIAFRHAVIEGNVLHTREIFTIDAKDIEFYYFPNQSPRWFFNKDTAYTMPGDQDFVPAYALPDTHWNYARPLQQLICEQLKLEVRERFSVAVSGLYELKEGIPLQAQSLEKITAFLAGTCTPQEFHKYTRNLTPSPLWHLAGACLLLSALILLTLCILSLAAVIAVEVAPVAGIGAVALFACGAAFFNKGRIDKTKLEMKKILTKNIPEQLVLQQPIAQH